MKSNKTLLITIAVVAMLTVPLAFGLSSVQIGGNFVGFEEDISGGIEIPANDYGFTPTPTVQDDYLAVVIEGKNGNTNLLHGNNSVNFDLSVPQDRYFVIYAKASKHESAFEVKLEITVMLNENPYLIEVILPYKAGFGTIVSEKYYSIHNVNGNKMLPIDMGQLDETMFMKCTTGDADLNIHAVLENN